MRRWCGKKLPGLDFYAILWFNTICKTAAPERRRWRAVSARLSGRRPGCAAAGTIKVPARGGKAAEEAAWVTRIGSCRKTRRMLSRLGCASHAHGEPTERKQKAESNTATEVLLTLKNAYVFPRETHQTVKISGRCRRRRSASDCNRIRRVSRRGGAFSPLAKTFLTRRNGRGRRLRRTQ